MCICLILLIISSKSQVINVVGIVDRLLYQLNIPAAFAGKLVFVVLLMIYIGTQPSL
jgi:hypothetical protein